MSEPINEGDPGIPEISGDQQPTLPFWQGTFDGHQKEIGQEERAYVESVFARTIDNLLDRADDVDEEGEETWGDEGTSRSCTVEAVDGRKCSVTVHYDPAGKIITRSVAIPWAKDWIGMTLYQVVYIGDDQPTVRRENDTGRVSDTLEWAEAHRASFEGMEMDRQFGLNDQPIEGREVDGLAGYLRSV